MGNYIVAEKNLETAAAEKRKYTIELFMGAPEDQNALTLYQGVMSVLQPYFDSKVLSCKTGRVAFEDVCTPGWSEEDAKADCAQYIAEHYKDALPDILCTASDDLAQGCAAALEELENAPGENWPLITGQGADSAAVQRILAGQQAMSAYVDRQALVQSCLEVTEAIITLSPEKIGNASFYNGLKAFPGCLVLPVTVDAQNCQEVLADSGVDTPA
jgi:putative multiple sugar transport system substrate-binding protein